jgi:hypothetical protein
MSVRARHVCCNISLWMSAALSPSLSIVLPFADHEDVLGAGCRRLAGHCRALGISFELLAIDEGSGDNSHALLALLRPELPELRILTVPGPDRAFAAGAAAARGRTVMLVEPLAATRSLAALDAALTRLGHGADLVILPGRFAVARRTRALGVLDPTRGRGPGFERRLARRASRRGLRVDTFAGTPEPAVRREGGVARLFGALLFATGR